jgi:predicted membrane channel-forming protein YqfA (hemolysin III family)
MKCPHCGKNITAQAAACRHCGVHFVRKSDKIVRRMTVNAYVAMACGGLLSLLAVIALFSKAYFLGLILAAFGVTFMIIGRVLRQP